MLSCFRVDPEAGGDVSCSSGLISTFLLGLAGESSRVEVLRNLQRAIYSYDGKRMARDE